MALSYFSKLPIIEYPLDKTSNKKARDILHRLFFDQKFLDQSGYIRKYEVREGDRPEIISHRLYGRSDLYSVIMLLNSFDSSMLSGLPPMSSIYDEYLNEKYSDDVYYVSPVGVNLSILGDGLSGGYVFPLLQRSFAPGEMIFGAGADGFQIYSIRAYVKEWNPVHSSLKLDILEGVFAKGMTLANNNGNAHFKIAHKKNGREAVHHFESVVNTFIGGTPLAKGMVIDPLSRINVSGGGVSIIPMGIFNHGSTGSYVSSLIHSYNVLGGDISASQKPFIKVVTNQEHEERTQEQKRTINVPAQDNILLGDVVSTVSEILESTTG